VCDEWAGTMTALLFQRRRAPASRNLRLLLALTVAAAALYGAQPALSASPSGLVVTPHPLSQPGLSYFKLSAQPGSVAQAGTVELRNPSTKRLRVALARVDGETLGTLGSSYAPPGSHPHGSTLWLRLGRRQATLSPGDSLVVPVSVLVPSGAKPGDYLSGVSVEALNQRSHTVKRRGVSIASVSRYVIGAEVSLPGPRRPFIRFTGATIRREPSGLTFALLARNSGNAILQGVHGQVRITRSGHVVVTKLIEPGTFVAHTSIAYPVNAFRQTPTEGTHYGVSAWLLYPGGIARLNTTLTFGHRAAVAQQQYGGPPAAGGGTAWWKIAAVVAVILYALLTTALLLRRRIRGSRKPAQP
jgi:hypothetical protein